jgi:AcrR family transcriptional regulator
MKAPVGDFEPEEAEGSAPGLLTESRPAQRARAAHLGPERRRPLVLDSAFELFLERGFEGTSMEAVAQAAGVSKPVVYDCYPSKEALFNALLRREEERMLAEIAAALSGSADEGSLEDILVRALTAFLRAVAASPDAYRVVFLGVGGANAAVADRVQRGRMRQVEALAALVRPLLGGFEVDGALDREARLLGHVVVGLAEAGARAMLSEPHRWTPEYLGATLGRLAASGHGQAR